jgi:4,5-DOPA dioxygenase extradiol
VRVEEAVTAVFFAHGSPMVAVESDDFSDALGRFGASLPRPRAVVVLSAHWEAQAPLRVTAAERPTLLYDFTGFPPELYDVRYPCPGDPQLAGEIATTLGGTLDSGRGLDHGAWVPLRHAFPSADIPVVEVSIPTGRSPKDLVRMGQRLAPLREQGVLLVGSGGIVHNLQRVRLEDKHAPVEGWANEFDTWVWARARTLDLGSLSTYSREAPHASLAVPTTEHFDPLFFVLGAARPGDRVSSIFEGFHHGNLSMRSFAVSQAASEASSSKR